MTIDDHPYVPLLFGPSPVHRLERLSAELGGRVEIWAKREDCNSGLAYGGNKIRKLEYLAADALTKGCDTLVSIGGVQSNHTRQVAAVAARLGLRCVLVQEHWVDWPDAVYDKVGNILLSRIMGADVRLVDAGFDIALRPSWQEALDRRRGGGRHAVPDPCGSVRPSTRGAGLRALGARGRPAGAAARRLLRHDCRLCGDRLDAGGDDRGLRRRRRVSARCSASTPPRRSSKRGTRSRASRGGPPRRLALGRELADEEIVLLDEWHAGTYGIPDEKTIEAIRLCARLEGMLTDPCMRGSRWPR